VPKTAPIAAQIITELLYAPPVNGLVSEEFAFDKFLKTAK